MFPEPRLDSLLDWLQQAGVDQERWLETALTQARHLTQALALQALLKVLIDWRESGLTFAQWQQRVEEQRLTSLIRDQRTLVETALQQAYIDGRIEGAGQDYLLFTAILDSRTSVMCQERDGIIRPASDPFWRRNRPPLHPHCRSSLMRLTAQQAWLRSGGQRGLHQAEPTSMPVEGFGSPNSLRQYLNELWRQIPADWRTRLSDR